MLIFVLHSSFLWGVPGFHHYAYHPHLAADVLGVLLNFAILIIQRVNLTTHFSWKKREKRMRTLTSSISWVKICCFSRVKFGCWYNQSTFFALLERTKLPSSTTENAVCSLECRSRAAVTWSGQNCCTKNQSDRKLRALFDFHNTH